MGELLHQLGLWLEAEGRPAAILHASGVPQFEPRAGLVAWGDILPDGRVEIFSAPGRVSSAWMPALFGDGESQEWFIVDRWMNRGAAWRVAIQQVTGRVLLSRAGPLPFEFGEWSAILQQFARHHEGCRLRVASARPEGSDAGLAISRLS